MSHRIRHRLLFCNREAENELWKGKKGVVEACLLCLLYSYCHLHIRLKCLEDRRGEIYMVWIRSVGVWYLFRPGPEWGYMLRELRRHNWYIFHMRGMASCARVRVRFLPRLNIPALYQQLRYTYSLILSGLGITIMSQK